MTPRHLKLFYGSSYDRGLDHLLFMWADIRKAVPEVELHCCYGWDLFDKVASNNPERMKWKAGVQMLMTQPGIVHHGRVGKEELSKIRKSCGIWAYPTDFQEINCITALDCQADGLVPVTMALAALPESVQSGVMVEGSIRELKTSKRYAQALILLLTDKERWEKESKKAQKWAKKFIWPKIAMKWNEVLRESPSTPSVSVITVTIREGWWEIMADNLKSQTYPITEWIIVDDHKDDRSDIAKQIADKYRLPIVYLRGTKKHRYGIVEANNIGWQNAKGELLVYLQDFVLMPETGIEWLVDIYRHHPNALNAPVDIYYECRQPDLNNKIDWWKGFRNNQIIGRKSWSNVRVENKGIRITDNPFDFEMNYGAVPRKVVKELNGWYEFMGNAFGFDNTDLAYRHLKNGGGIVLDDTNICKCINLWPHIGGTDANVSERERHQGGPMYKWLYKHIESGKLPIIRDEKLDKTIKIDYSVPKEVSDEDAAKWVKANSGQIVDKWGDL